MKKRVIAVVLLSVCAQVQAEESWWDSVKSFLGMEENKVAASSGLSAQSMVDDISRKLGVTPEQARGGLAAILNYVKQSADSEQFQLVSESIPGFEAVLAALPKISASTSQSAGQSALGGLLETASGYSESLRSLTELKKQFETLDMNPEMIVKFGQVLQGYLNTPEGQEAKQVFSEALNSVNI